MSIQTIVESAKTKLDQMGGGEQSIGHVAELAETCGVDEDEIIFWMAELGEALEAEGLQLISNKATNKLFVRSREV